MHVKNGDEQTDQRGDSRSRMQYADTYEACIYDACMCDACKKWGRTNKAILGVGWTLDQNKKGRKNIFFNCLNIILAYFLRILFLCENCALAVQVADD